MVIGNYRNIVVLKLARWWRQKGALEPKKVAPEKQEVVMLWPSLYLAEEVEDIQLEATRGVWVISLSLWVYNSL